MTSGGLIGGINHGNASCGSVPGPRTPNTGGFSGGTGGGGGRNGGGGCVSTSLKLLSCDTWPVGNGISTIALSPNSERNCSTIGGAPTGIGGPLSPGGFTAMPWLLSP